MGLACLILVGALLPAPQGTLNEGDAAKQARQAMVAAEPSKGSSVATQVRAGGRDFLLQGSLV
jgi:hypothetical protein